MNRKTRKQDEPIAYTEAVDELESILNEIEGADVDLDRLAGRVERASELVRLLKGRIRETEMKVTRVVEELREESGGPDSESPDSESPDSESPVEAASGEEELFEEDEEEDTGFTREVPF